jgi:hypothetical protein
MVDLRRLIVEAFAEFTNNTMSPISDEKGRWKCDECGRFSSNVLISPGDGYVECTDCYTKEKSRD